MRPALCSPRSHINSTSSSLKSLLALQNTADAHIDSLIQRVRSANCFDSPCLSPVLSSLGTYRFSSPFIVSWAVFKRLSCIFLKTKLNFAVWEDEPHFYCISYQLDFVSPSSPAQVITVSCQPDRPYNWTIYFSTLTERGHSSVRRFRKHFCWQAIDHWAGLTFMTKLLS